MFTVFLFNTSIFVNQNINLNLKGLTFLFMNIDVFSSIRVIVHFAFFLWAIIAC